MSYRFAKNTILDRETCYDMWVRQRISVYRIPSVLAEQGIVNPATGKHVTHQAVWRSANLYILDHPEMAKNDTVSLFAQHGKVLDDDEWGREMIARARQFLGKKQYSAWLFKNKDYHKYTINAQ